MLKKISIFILVFAFIIFGIFPKENFCYVKEVLSPLEIVLDNGSIFNLNGVEIFDSSFTERNKKLAEKFGLSEEEAFILGNLARYWSKNILEGRQVKLVKNNLIYYRYGYYEKFENTPFCIKDGKINNKSAFDKQVKSIRRAKFMVLDMDSDTYYHPDDPKVRSLNNFIVLRKSHLSKIFPQKNKEIFSLKLELSDIKILVSDFTRNLKPDRKCSDAICREILSNINNAQKTIDIAIYGYSSVPSVEKAILNAKNRGVKIRLVYDVDRKNENIYPDTFSLVKLIPDSMSDRNSQGVSSTMHDKFYIFDDKVVITGSANLSHTDMSGYNSNSIVVINSSEAALIYKREFEQMYSGKFHSDKISYYPQKFKNMQIYFSPQDKAVSKGILPLIEKAQNYIYIPAFIITEKRIVSSLIQAKNRGVDVKIIVDALNASNKYSKHPELRAGGIPVKTENYAGKMHSKSMIIDDKYTIIGSMNFSYSGENKNDENLVIIESPDVSRFYKNFFLYQWNLIPDKWLKYNARAESYDSKGSCEDGIDNDYDGLVDKDDTGCNGY